ncbi:helix-turn-helix transcriptional regulator [Hyphococcus sp.]|uniref:helix-turn-helix transcriptional regulator n=1 Tax=Hyphococcus sp. TaxID=2038636 RepID=UPI003CCBD933
MSKKTQKRIIRRAAVKAKTGITADSTLYYLIKNGKFPPPIKIGAGGDSARKGWLEDEIDDWIEARVAARDAAA